MISLDHLNSCSQEEARELFQRCCGARKWAAGMTSARPFSDFSSLLRKADQLWQQTDSQDRREAFAQHPKIGEIGDLRARFGRSGDWSQKEQAGVAAAEEETLRRLADGNRCYAKKFGFIFIVCASGKSAEEMLTLLDQRLNNNPETEMSIAGAEQHKITVLRLQKLLAFDQEERPL